MNKRSLIKEYGYTETEVFNMLNDHFGVYVLEDEFEKWLDGKLHISGEIELGDLLDIPRREWLWTNDNMTDDEWERLSCKQSRAFFNHMEGMLNLAKDVREDFRFGWDTKEQREILRYCDGFTTGIETAMLAMKHPEWGEQFRKIDAIRTVYAICKMGWFHIEWVEWRSPSIYEKIDLEEDCTRIKVISDRVLLDYRVFDGSTSGAVLIQRGDETWLRFLLKNRLYQKIDEEILLTKLSKIAKEIEK